jgi:hypothetical protein
MPDVVDTATSIVVVGAFDIASAEIGGFSADFLAFECVAVCFVADFDLVATTAWLVVCVFHLRIDGVIDGFDAVRVVDRELGIVGCLDAWLRLVYAMLE